MGLSNEIIELVFGKGYEKSSIVLRIIIWAEVLFFANLAFKNLLNSINKQTIVALQGALCLFINVFANLILVPKYSYIGAGISLLVTELTAFLFLLGWIMKSEYRFSHAGLVNTVKIMIVVLIVLMPLLYRYNVPTTTILSIVLCIILIYLFRVVDDTDVKLIRSIFTSLRTGE